MRHLPQRTLTVGPLEPAVPAKTTRPVQAERTGSPGRAAKSTPRWRPAAKGSPA
jgi:hypothetical protein